METLFGVDKFLGIIALFFISAGGALCVEAWFLWNASPAHNGFAIAVVFGPGLILLGFVFRGFNTWE